MDKRIGFELYQSCGNRGSVGRVWAAVVHVGSGLRLCQGLEG